MTLTKEKRVSKFLIENDIGLALDKVNAVISLMRSEDGFEVESREHMDDTLIEVLAHLSQAQTNLQGI